MSPYGRLSTAHARGEVLKTLFNDTIHTMMLSMLRRGATAMSRRSGKMPRPG